MPDVAVVAFARHDVGDYQGIEHDARIKIQSPVPLLWGRHDRQGGYDVRDMRAYYLHGLLPIP